MTFFQFHPNVRLRIVTVFTNTLASNTVFPFMAIFLSQEVGLGAASFSLSLAIVLNLVSNMVGGYLADVVGRKKIMLLADGLRIVTYLVLAAVNSPWVHIPLITVIFFLVNNICSGLYTPAAEAMLLDVTSSSERRYMYSLIYWTTNLSIAFGGMLGAFMFNGYLFFLFLLLVVSAVFSFLITIVWIQDTYVLGGTESGDTPNYLRKKKNGIVELLRNYKLVMKDRVFLIFILGSMLLFSLENHMGNFVAIRLEQELRNAVLYPFNWKLNGLSMFGYLRTENTVCVILLSLWIGKWLKGLNERRVLFAGFVLYLIGYGVISFSNQPWILFLMMILAVLGEILFVPIYESFLGDLAPDQLRSSYLAMNKIAFKGSALLGSIAIYLVHVLSMTGVIVMIWVSGIAGMLFLYLIIPAIEDRRQHQKSRNQQSTTFES